MKRVGAYEAKTHLSKLRNEVSRGARISITRKGVPVAMMVPPSSRRKEDVVETIRRLKEFRKGITLGKISVRELVDAGTPSRAMGDILSLARDQDLSVYDAAYLELAIREGLPLATRDKGLAEAAKRCGIPVR